MIKRYLQFINEKYGDFDTIGEYIENLAGDDETCLHIISQFIQDIDPSVRVANAINLLDDHTQKVIKNQIEEYKSGDQIEDEPEISTYVNANLLESNNSGGKNLFKCFLKVITALGQKDLTPDWNKTPDHFLMVFKTPKINVVDVKSVMARYRFFDLFIGQLDYRFNECQLYYAISCKMNFTYGIINDEQAVSFGSFKLTKGMLNYLLTLESPSAIPIKKYLSSLNLEKISLFVKIKSDMKNYIPGSCEQRANPIITDDVITFGFYGLGRWDNGVMDPAEVENAKTNLTNFLMQYRWTEKVQVSVTANNFWLNFNFKIK